MNPQMTSKVLKAKRKNSEHKYLLTFFCMSGTQTNTEAISVSRTSRSHFWTIFIHGCVNSLQIGLLFLEFYLFLAIRQGNQVIFQSARVPNSIIPLLNLYLIIEEACFINMSMYTKKAGPRKQQCSYLCRWDDGVGNDYSWDLTRHTTFSSAKLIFSTFLALLCT